MWQAAIGKEFTVDDLFSTLMNNYDVDEHIAKDDAQRIMNEWKEMGLIE